MKITITGNFDGAVHKTSAKGNAYTILRIRQANSFDYIDVLVKNDLPENHAKRLKELALGEQISADADYNPKYKSFSLLSL